MRSKNAFVLVLCFITILAILGVFIEPVQAKTQKTKTLKIGVIWGLTGPGSQVQVLMKDGAMLAKDWINSKGGVRIKGKKYMIELLVEDNKNSPDGAISAATKLVHQEKVSFVTGMVVPIQYEAAQTVTEANKVILVVAKMPYLIPKNRYTFSSTQGYTVPYPSIYGFLKKNYPGVKTVGYTVNDEPGGIAVQKVAREIAQAHGFKLYDTVLTQFGTKDYYPVWTKILKDKPDAVDLVIGFPDQIAAAARHGRELGFKGPIITCNTGDAAIFPMMIGKEFATDFIFGGYAIDDPKTPRMIKRIAKFWEKKYKSKLNMDGLDGWSTISTLIQAIEKAQSLDSTKVAKTWGKMKKIETIYGPGTMGGAKTFGINHMVIGPIPVSLLKDGKLAKTEWFHPVLP